MVRPPGAIFAGLAALVLDASSQVVRDAAVELTASPADSPAAIALAWPATPYPLSRQELHRRNPGNPDWQALAAPLPPTATAFTDPDIVPGRPYEYRLARQFAGEPHLALGYLCAGARIPVPDDRGRLILLVEQSLATPLSNEIATLTTDLTGDGWSVTRLEVAAATPPPAVRSLIQAARATEPAATNTLLIIGHIAVPYAGRIAPDSHSNHLGAWPTDAYYADADGTWTDTSVDLTNSFRAANHNQPGDGKFDQSYLDGDRAPELAAGRIDFSDLPGAGWNEVELTRRYLARNHAWRHALPPYQSVPRRALIDDQFGFFFGEAFAANGWRSFAALVGGAQCHAGEWLDELATQPYLLAYGCGPGNLHQVGGVATAADFFATPSRAVFTALFGSFSGDWDTPDNVLRAALAGPDGSLGLTAIWAGRPQVPLHLLGRGATIGDCLRAAQLNPGDWQSGYLSGIHARGIHLGLLGDPSLHLFPSSPPTGLTATGGAGTVTLSWTAPATAGVQGYIVARAPAPGGPYFRLRQDLVTSTTFTDRTITPGAAAHYRVRPVVLATHPGGTLLAPGQAAFVAAQAGGPAPAPDLRITGNGMPVAHQDTTPSRSNNTLAAGPGPLAFAITNVGAAPLSLTGMPDLAGPGAAQFRIVAAPPDTLAPGQSAGLAVEFVPAASGTAEATLNLASNDIDQNPFSIALAGDATGCAGRIQPVPAIVACGLPPAATATRQILLENPGPGPLTFRIANPFESYRSRDSHDPDGPAFVWHDITSHGTLISFPDADDSLSAPVPIGFSFPFAGTGRTTFRICTNGYLTFADERPSSIANPPLPNPAAPPELIAGFWHDLILLPDSTVHVSPTADSCTVQFTNLADVVDPDQRVTFQIVLHAAGTISLIYQRVDRIPAFANAGVQETFATRGFNLPAPPAAHHAATIFPPGFGSWLTLEPATGTIPPGGSLQLALTIDATAAGPGRHRLAVPVTTSDPHAPKLEIPLALEVAPAPSPRAAWRLAAFRDPANTGPAADSADPDHDTFSNLLEYALGTHPLDPGSRPLPTLVPGAFSFRRNATLDDVDLTVQVSADFTSWANAATSQAGGPVQALALPVLDDSGPTDLKSVTLDPPEPPAFLRFLATPRGD